jgi:zinc transporter ZupT
MKTLIKLDLLVYIVISLATFLGGILMITAERDISPTSKNMDEALTYLGIFILLIGIVCCIVTFIKIRDTNFKDH